MGAQQTSIDTFHDIKMELGERQAQVYEILKDYYSRTNLEISALANIPINQITPRTNELVKLNLVEQHEKRRCSISGRIAISWRIRE